MKVNGTAVQIFHLLSNENAHSQSLNSEDKDKANKMSPLESRKLRSIEKTKPEIKNNSNAKECDDLVRPVKNSNESSIAPVKDKKTLKVSTGNAGRLLKAEHEKHIISLQYERNLVGRQSDVDFNDPEQLKSVFYEPNKSLQSSVELARAKSEESERIIQLDILDYIFYFDFQERRVYGITSLSTIRSLCVIEYEHKISYSVKDSAFRDKLYDCFCPDIDKSECSSLATRYWNIDYFMWVVALWCSRGRLPVGTSLVRPVYLTQWPNLTRLEPISYAVRIAALIYERPYTLVNIAEILKIEQRYVFAFFSACKSLGLFSDLSQDAEKNITVKKPKNKSILSKLLGRLVNVS